MPVLKYYDPADSTWKALTASSGIAVQAEPPASPADGDLWLDTDEMSASDSLTAPRTWGVEGLGQNTVPTTLTVVPGSSKTFTLDVETTVLITFFATLQSNATGGQPKMYLYLDGVSLGGEHEIILITTANLEGRATGSRTARRTLPAGSHTIDLRGLANTAGNTVIRDGGWWATEVAVGEQV